MPLAAVLMLATAACLQPDFSRSQTGAPGGTVASRSMAEAMAYQVVP